MKATKLSPGQQKQIKPGAAQTKGGRPQPAPGRPAAPPVYRPQSPPRVLQAKMAGDQKPSADRPAGPPAALPVYRPEAKKVAQSKPAPAAQPRMTPDAAQPARPAAASAATARHTQRHPAFGPQSRGAGQQPAAKVVQEKRASAGALVARPVGLSRPSPTARPPVAQFKHPNAIQRTMWRWGGAAWVAQAETKHAAPPFPGRYPGEFVDDEDQNADWQQRAAAASDSKSSSVAKPKEVSSIKEGYNVKTACVLQSLISAGLAPFGKGSAKLLHDHIYGQEALAGYKEYDLDDVYPKLYKAAGLELKPATKTVSDLADELKPGKYILEFGGGKQAGHNMVISVSGKGKKKTWAFIQDSNNVARYTEKDAVSGYWAKKS